MPLDFSKPPSLWTDEEVRQFMAESARRDRASRTNGGPDDVGSRPWDRPTGADEPVSGLTPAGRTE